MAGRHPGSGRVLFFGHSAGVPVTLFCTDEGYGIQSGGEVVGHWKVDDVAAAVAAFLGMVDRPGESGSQNASRGIRAESGRRDPARGEGP